LGVPDLDCASIIDERSAAFAAVGEAKVTGQPTALVCTSGSAAANYLPALVEARQSGTPVLVFLSNYPPVPWAWLVRYWLMAVSSSARNWFSTVNSLSLSVMSRSSLIFWLEKFKLTFGSGCPQVVI
jgi:hypothetical protein